MSLSLVARLDFSWHCQQHMATTHFEVSAVFVRITVTTGKCRGREPTVLVVNLCRVTRIYGTTRYGVPVILICTLTGHPENHFVGEI